MNNDFIERNAGVGNELFTIGLRLSRTFPLGEKVRMEGLAEAFNAFNHRNNLTRNGVFGTGVYPANPSPTFGQINSVNDPRVIQFALRFKF